MSFDNVQQMERRIQVSAEVSDYVYDYEKRYTKLKAKHGDWSAGDINKEILSKIRTPDDTQIFDAIYDPETGIAAHIATLLTDCFGD